MVIPVIMQSPPSQQPSSTSWISSMERQLVSATLRIAFSTRGAGISFTSSLLSTGSSQCRSQGILQVFRVLISFCLVLPLESFLASSAILWSETISLDSSRRSFTGKMKAEDCLISRRKEVMIQRWIQRILFQKKLALKKFKKWHYQVKPKRIMNSIHANLSWSYSLFGWRLSQVARLPTPFGAPNSIKTQPKLWFGATICKSMIVESSFTMNRSIQRCFSISVSWLSTRRRWLYSLRGSVLASNCAPTTNCKMVQT